MDSYILGLNLGHDPSAAIVDRNGNVLSAILESRLSRFKKERRFPHRAIRYVIHQAGINASKISVVTYCNYQKNETSLIRTKYLASVGSLTASSTELIQNAVSSLNIFPESISRIDHHFAHACVARISSPHRDLTVITGDGFGDDISFTIRKIKDGNVPESVDFSLGVDSSLGLIYQYLTGAIGFSMLSEEWKILGLENSGVPENLGNEISDLLIKKNNTYIWNTKTLSPFLNSDAPSIQEKMRALRLYFVYLNSKYDSKDLCAAVQDLVEKTVLELIDLHLDTPQNIAVGGGLFLNVKLNRLLLNHKKVKDIRAFPCSGDGGLSIGSALGYLNKRKDHSFSKYFNINFFSSHEYDYDPINNNLEICSKHNSDDSLHEEIVQLINANKIVWLCKGGSEYGPRALLNRSIICKANILEITSKLNNILERDFFMPFGCSILEEEFKEVCQYSQNENLSSYMMIALMVTDEFANSFPAVVHAQREGGYSTRAQVVNKEDGWKYALLSKLKDVCGTSTILNTSFNKHGEPIVETSTDAIKTFVECADEDCFLVIGRNIYKKSSQTIKIKKSMVKKPRKGSESTVLVLANDGHTTLNYVLSALEKTHIKIDEIKEVDNNRFAFFCRGIEANRVVKDTFEYCAKVNNVTVLSTYNDYKNIINENSLQLEHYKYYYYANLCMDIKELSEMKKDTKMFGSISLIGLVSDNFSGVNIEKVRKDLETTVVFGKKIKIKGVSTSLLAYSPTSSNESEKLIDLPYSIDSFYEARRIAESGYVTALLPDETDGDEIFPLLKQCKKNGVDFIFTEYDSINNSLSHLIKDYFADSHINFIGGGNGFRYGCHNQGKSMNA